MVMIIYKINHDVNIFSYYYRYYENNVFETIVRSNNQASMSL